jgi:hypothetical protein
VSQLLQRGFSEIDAHHYALADAAAITTLGERFCEQDGADFRLLDWATVDTLVQTRFYNDPAEYLANKLLNFRVHDVAAVHASNLTLRFDSLSPEVQTGSRNLVYRHGLTVQGNLDAGSLVTTIPQFVHIDGDLHVHHLVLTGWVDMVVTGSIFASGTVLVCEGESGGSLQVGGSLHAQALLGGCEFDIAVAGDVQTPVYWLDEESPLEASTVTIKIPTVIAPADWPDRAAFTALADGAYMEDTDWSSEDKRRVYNFVVEKAVASLRAGQPLFRAQDGGNIQNGQALFP